MITLFFILVNRKNNIFCEITEKLVEKRKIYTEFSLYFLIKSALYLV